MIDSIRQPCPNFKIRYVNQHSRNRQLKLRKLTLDFVELLWILIESELKTLPMGTIYEVRMLINQTLDPRSPLYAF